MNCKSVHLRAWRFAGVLALAAASVLMNGCGFLFDPGAANIAEISAAGNLLRVNQTLKLNTMDPVSWSVNGIPGGNSEIGTIDANGVYTAPAIVPSPNNQVVVTSASKVYAKAVGSFQISVLNPIPIITSVTPSSFSEGTALITVTGSQFIFGAQIVWDGGIVPTTYISGTQLAASVHSISPGTYPVAVINPDPGPATSANLSELVGPGHVVVTLTPQQGAVRLGNTLQFTAMVTGSVNTGVTWAVNGIAGGNAAAGLISNAGLYTPPPTVTVASSLTTISAISVDDPTKSGQLTIEVFNPVPLLLSGTPSSFDPGPATITVVGANYINGAQVLLNGAPVATTFNSAGQLTASVNVTTPGPLDLQVLNPDPGGAASTDLVISVNGAPPALPVSPEDASRFLAQASFGPTDADIHHLSQIGYQAWIDEQVALAPKLHEPYVEQQVIINNVPCAAGDTVCNQKLFMGTFGDSYVQQSFWNQAITGQDQLRQRVKYALLQIFVVSSTDGTLQNMPRGIANYYDVLGADAFTNYRQIIQDVTLSPMMGVFLSSMANDKGDANRDPDENYAREVMQLFSIGLNQLNADGTQQLDGSGNSIPTYSNVDVEGIAKVFTGFSWNVPGEVDDTAWSGAANLASPGHGPDLLPMQAYANHHSPDEKDFLGVTIPASAGADPNGDLTFALDTLFNHPNAPAFFSRQMIEHLVTSNPSAAYVGRVANAFRDNGSGVRGDMKAIITAILLDDEARTDANVTNPQYGKLREPIIRATGWARAFTAESKSGLYDFGNTEDPIYGFEEMPFRSPTVFNWFAPGFSPAGTSIETAGLVAPEMQITDESSVVGYLNFMQGSIAGYNQDLASTYAAELPLATNPDALMDRMNLLLMAGQMTPELRAQIEGVVSSVAIPAGDQNAINAALLNRVELAIFFTMASPDYIAQR